MYTGLYVLENRVVFLINPRIRISNIKEQIPHYLITIGANYLDTQGWQDRPLYILDENVAYVNDAIYSKEINDPQTDCEVASSLETCIYGIGIAKATKKLDPNYDDIELKAFLKWNTERTIKLFEPNYKQANAYLECFRASDDSRALRQFSREYFGEDWCKKILGF